jgi:K(+)-stimulated pyrophosphate-energized sodium pump
LEFFMVSQDDDSTGLVMGVIFGVIALVVSLVIGVTIYQKNKTMKAQAPVAAVAAPAASADAGAAGAGAAAAAGATQAKSDLAMDAAARAAAGAAVVLVDAGVVKFFFASGKTELPEGGLQALTVVVAGAKDGKKVNISGYVDSTGNAAQNKELAKQRAFAVRDLLKAAGVADDQIELVKPEDIQAGSGAQARRVEVTLK